VTVADLDPAEYAPFYANYILQVPAGLDPVRALADSGSQLTDHLNKLNPVDHDYAYAPGKWTVREALQHVIDTERIFGYRILRLGRRDGTPLPGFEQNDYADRARVDHRPVAGMIEEFALLRRGTRLLVESLSDGDLTFVGTASGAAISTRAMAYIAAGHVYHHVALYRSRYARTA
jgi:hypothetical protein